MLTTVYTNDFENISDPLSEWSNTLTDFTPGTEAHPVDRFLGQFGNDLVELNLDDLPYHNQIKVLFDLYVIRSWDGKEPDKWGFRVDDGMEFITSFALVSDYYTGFRQSYPDPYPEGDYPAGTGALEVNTLGFYWDDNAPIMDSVYRISFTFPHSASSLGLDFFAEGLQELLDESWGIDNIEVVVVDPYTGGPDNDTIVGGVGDDAMNGKGGNDVVIGGKGNDNILGETGTDLLAGEEGNDTLNGGTGADIMVGGLGNDNYTVDNLVDRIVEESNGATDTVNSFINYVLQNYLENLILTGKGNINGTGNTLKNNLTGNAGNNLLVGNGGNDTLTGGGGNDILVGGAGFDLLTGGTGADEFRFNALSEKIDTLQDFLSATDKITINKAGFSPLLATGVLPSKQFVLNAAPIPTTSPTFIYKTTGINGQLFFDANGSGVGGATQFATLTGKPALSASDINIF
ncbi:MAG: calcium-binding protein [Gomphosphaeria aponina SAG 52.96 = DSM 107014]|uniref:Calcium-binding protein n=1 Tax=Gomphosphaeria aponina SAG 52.96 = DSM 107014 TaxID=1521640 RepID=A0A941GRV3_9CHRO|nr:calcium-binding protein [Gomphosphaeria aponina SAG 52.96 = DSM 107014]